MNCHMLTCPRAVVHLLLSQLKVLEKGLLHAVYDLEIILNRASTVCCSIPFGVHSLITIKPCQFLFFCSFQFVEQCADATGSEIEEELNRHVQEMLQSSQIRDRCSNVSTVSASPEILGFILLKWQCAEQSLSLTV